MSGMLYTEFAPYTRNQHITINSDDVYCGADASIRPEHNVVPRHCKFCHKRLSIYNLTNHCLNFTCSEKAQRKYDQSEETRLQKVTDHIGVLQKQKRRRYAG